jgi:hypothetical protein
VWEFLRTKVSPRDLLICSNGLPRFFSHVTTAYDLLCHNGVETGKKDLMGAQ